ncbi:CBO0543 family protein [Paenibacillus arenilitoris]|uniref:Uncharacterized protein n=1 Tax=Paenibacillus arenilitoris TaxID=2772299 RepID=A0A927CMY9_9BACL|nr:CBO0543 family protein [Paenibacillus arenilitoris]MBD2870375.1 hypothetical protein [Paenibacillus arenilitoris]
MDKLHVAIGLWTILAVWRWGDWRNWKKYYPTMLYMSLGACVYLFLYGQDALWNPRPSLLLDKQNELLYLFVIMPCSALLYLSNFPAKLKSKLIHISKWILIYILVEWIGYLFHEITYNSGWNLWWSLVFDMIMFPMLILHHRRPLLALVLSVFAAMGLMAFFPPHWG